VFDAQSARLEELQTSAPTLLFLLDGKSTPSL
jgi:hypothetical protein